MNTAVNPSWWLKLGDNIPPLERTATLPDGSIVDLTATVLELRWQLVDNDGVPLSTAPVETGVPAIIDAVAGEWLYNWTPAPSAAGVYAASLPLACWAQVPILSEYLGPFFDILGLCPICNRFSSGL